MDILGRNADYYRMEINPQKTKVTIFNERRKNRHNTVFSKVGPHEIKITDQYRYLGVILNNNGSFKNHVIMLLEKADKCTYALLAKNREWKGFKPRLSLNLSNHLISPILSYGCEVWGNYDWAEIERLHLWFCKFALGVKVTP